MSPVLPVFAVFWLAGCHSSPRPQVDFTPLQVSRKVVLVIGNTSYQELSSVAAASPDAYDVAAALRGLQFDVVDVKANLTARELAEAIDTFCRRIQKGDLAVVYYSGHGGQAGGESYLSSPGGLHCAPGGRPGGGARNVSHFAPARSAGVQPGTSTSDDFRCHPGRVPGGFPGSQGRAAGHPEQAGGYDRRLFGSSRWHHAVRSRAAWVYTAELLSMLRAPERDLKEMLDEVQLRMYRLTKGRQMPFLEGTLESPLYFGFVPEPAAGREERSSWASAEQADTAAGYQSYLQQFPKGAFVERARMKLAIQQPKASFVPGDTKVNPKDGQEYAWIPAGSFMLDCMGDSRCRPQEMPTVHITFEKGFRIGVTEVTVGAWKRYRKAAGAAALPTKDPDGRGNLNEAAGNDMMPAMGMTRDEARSYCTWMGGRLPKEEEWEYAARAGSTGLDPAWEDSAWYAGNSGIRWLNSSEVKSVTPAIYNAQLYGNEDGPHPVAQKKPNVWGLYDTLGNVWEWAESRAPAAKLGVLRGGAWTSTEFDMYLARRMEMDPGVQVHDIGFRCVWDAR